MREQLMHLFVNEEKIIIRVIVIVSMRRSNV